jgi:hypothetical protein
MFSRAHWKMENGERRRGRGREGKEREGKGGRRWNGGVGCGEEW